MALVARTLAYLADRLWRRFEAVSADPLAAQKTVLNQFLRKAADTQWGRQFHFAEISTIEQFRQRVPITRYEDAAPLWHRAFEGIRDVTWPGHTQFFALSSGTTAGNKFLPVTEDAIHSNLRAGTLLAVMMLRRGAASGDRVKTVQQLGGGSFMYLGGSTTLRPRGQCLCGDASGIMGRRIPFYVRKRRLPEPDIAAITDWDQKIPQLVQRYLAADIRALSACPSWAALLFKQLLQYARDRNPAANPRVGELWPNFSFFISFGMAFEPYRTSFLDLIGRPIHFIDSYSSSEGGMNGIQEEDGGPLRLIVDNGVFFEFIPADKALDANPPRLHFGEIQTGVDYALLLSTNGGIWAYPLGDVIRFESLSPPRFRFVGRTQLMLSAFGEHVTLEMIETAVSVACRESGAIVADYTIEPLYPSPTRSKPGHRWLMEFDRPPAEASTFIAAIDRSIRAACEDYDTHRTNNFGMDPPELTAVAPGTFYEWMKRHGKLGGQHKVPRVFRPEAAAELRAIAQERSGAKN
jgi:hypothetical protein